jgi:glycopeptide antibiotics resistance protein
VALEFAQEATGYRSFELADMAVNSLGVLLGWGISATLRR